MFTSNLCWSVMEAIRKNVISTTGVIHRFGNIFNVDCRKKLINSFVMLHVRYCLPVWGNSNAGSATKLNASLLCVARLVLHVKIAEFNTNTNEATGIMSFKLLVFLSNVCCISKFLQQNSLNNNTNTVLMHESVINNTRSATSSKIQLLKHDRSADVYCFQVADILLTGTRCLSK